MIPSSLMPRPQVLLFVERRNSSSVTGDVFVFAFDLEAEEALAERWAGLPSVSTGCEAL